MKEIDDKKYSQSLKKELNKKQNEVNRLYDEIKVGIEDLQNKPFTDLIYESFSMFGSEDLKEFRKRSIVKNIVDLMYLTDKFEGVEIKICFHLKKDPNYFY